MDRYTTKNTDLRGGGGVNNIVMKAKPIPHKDNSQSHDDTHNKPDDSPLTKRGSALADLMVKSLEPVMMTLSSYCRHSTEPV